MFCGDSRSLGLADAAYDAVVAHTLISHVDDPAAVLREIARVVQPGGKVGIFDGDYASMTFGSDDPQQGRADDEAPDPAESIDGDAHESPLPS